MIRFSLLVAVLSLGLPAFAGEITGQVWDQTGASVSGAKIVLTRLSDGKEVLSAVADVNGSYTLKNISSSTQYAISAVSPGFATVRYSPIYTMEGRSQHLDFVLPVADCGEGGVVPKDEAQTSVPSCP